MLAYIAGKLLVKTENSCIILTPSGVGYEIFVTDHVLYSLPERGEYTELYTAFIVREDAQELFGFSTWDERQCFLMLISINRVGARTAIAILSRYNPDDLRRIVAQDDVLALTQVSGIGKQTAQKVFLELKYKLKGDGDSVILAPSETFNSSVFRDALTGLTNLGYDEIIATQVLKEILKENSDYDVSMALRTALKVLGKMKEQTS